MENRFNIVTIVKPENFLLQKTEPFFLLIIPDVQR